MRRGKGNEAGAQTSISALCACPLKANPREMMLHSQQLAAKIQRAHWPSRSPVSPPLHVSPVGCVERQLSPGYPA